jgi:PAS domain S-box-containing protein
MIALLALYEDWLPFLVAAAYVVVHHGLMGALDPGGVYNHPDAAAHPWKWAAIHGAFVAAAGAASVTAWRLNEDVRADTRRAYEQVRRSEARLAEAQRLAQIGSWEWEISSGIVTWSDELYRVFGVDPSEWNPSYESFVSLVDPADRERVERMIWEAVETRTSFRYECAINRPDGAARIIDAYGETVVADGSGPKLVGTAQDVTARREVEAELARRDDVERDYQARSEFLSRISHELRTPLNAILGFAQVLEMEDLPPRQHDSVRQILKGGDHLLNLINEVLDISRLQAGNMTISLEPVQVESVLAEALSLVQPLAAGRNVTFVNKLCSEGGSYVEADKQRLKQVFLNLLSNAIKYNREGGSVTLSLEEPASGRALILVTDTGMGIHQSKLEQVFVPFDRLGAEETGVEGTGLGLTLSKLLVEAMNGTLEVESEPYIGSTFIVGLEKAEPQTGRVETLAELDSAPPAGIDGRSATVLYVEDNLSNLRLVERLLESVGGVTLIPSLEGNLALDLARQHRPDLVLLDLHLPGIDGEAVLEQLKADPTLSDIPIVVVSADATPSRVERVLAKGAQQFLTKPLDVRRFLEVVNETLTPRLAA